VLLSQPFAEHQAEVRLPILDLRDTAGRIDRLAIFSVLTVMVHPEPSARAAREKMMATVRADVLGRRPGRTPTQLPSEFLAQVKDATPAGGLSGAILIGLCELKRAGKKPNLREAIELATDTMSAYSRREGNDEPHALRGLANRAAAIEAWKRFQRVRHLWAAHVHNPDPRQSGLGRTQLLPRFLQLAESYATEASSIRLLVRTKGRREIAIDPKIYWQFDLPKTAQI
jgi:hypothetical protein